jgi:hypothetical protein
MTSSSLVSLGVVFKMFAASAALASTSVTTEFGRPLMVNQDVSVAACSDFADSAVQAAQSWQDALAGKRAEDRLVQASWNNALADKRVEARALALAADVSECALIN